MSRVESPYSEDNYDQCSSHISNGTTKVKHSKSRAAHSVQHRAQLHSFGQGENAKHLQRVYKDQRDGQELDNVINHNGKDQMYNGHRSRTYEEAIRDICTLQSNAVAIATANLDPSERMPLFIRHLTMAGIDLNELDRLNVIHVSGTKGKGSTCAFVESILQSNHCRTGFFNSPHLIKYTERIRLNGQPLSDEKFTMYFDAVFDRLKTETHIAGIKMPAFFAFMTILAFYTFLREKVQVAIMEVGIGGLLDTTNVINRPVVCGITSLDYDHLSILGSTIESIAKHKAGIIKREVPVFTVGQPDEAMTVIKAQASFMDSPLTVCPPIESYNLGRDLDLGIKGQAQGTNASLAIQLSLAWMSRHESKQWIGKLAASLDSNLSGTLTRGLTGCRWPGRCQLVRRGNVSFFLDGAHTKNSLLNCRNWFEEASYRKNHNHKDVRHYLILNIIGDRSRESLMELLIDLRLDAAIFTTNKVYIADNVEQKPAMAFGVNDEAFDGPQSYHTASIWRDLSKKRHRNHDCHHEIVAKRCTYEAIQHIDRVSKEQQASEHHVLVTGSLHLVGAILEALELFEKNKRC